MKILFCTSSMGKGGAERVISILSNNLIKDNEITILVNTNKNIAYKLDDSINIITLDKKYKKNSLIRNISRIKKTKKVLKEQKPDIIISFLPMPSFRIIIANIRMKIPVIISDRNDPKQEYKSKLSNILMNWLYPKANGFVFQTKEQKRYFKDEIQKKSRIIFNPINDCFLKENKIVKKENTIINIGRLMPQKNQIMLINAFSEIIKKYPQYKLKIFGEGPLKESLKKRIEDLNIEDKAFLCGLTDNIKEELENSKIFVLSSNYEGMPNVLIEAMATGCASISTDCPCGGPREFIENYKNGILITVGDEKELENSIEKLIKDEEKIKELGENAKKIKEKLKTEDIINQWKEYIQTIIGKK